MSSFSNLVAEPTSSDIYLERLVSDVDAYEIDILEKGYFDRFTVSDRYCRPLGDLTPFKLRIAAAKTRV